MRFRDRTVWITGASSGIGEALAREFALEGARLVLSSRRADKLERVRQSCQNPAEHVIAPFDLQEIASFPSVVDSVRQRCGNIDVLVNNAGVSQRGLALDTRDDVERLLMEVNYFAPVALSKAVAGEMRARRAGHLVVISSVMGYLGTPGRSTYSAAKHALHGYFDSWRAELWRDGVHVTLACPGYVKTHISQNALGPNGMTRTPSAKSAERGIAPERCARRIVRAVAARRLEVYVGASEVWSIYLQRFLPRLTARVVRKLPFPSPSES